MSKILLVYDDFAELNATELSLKKVGFDVIGLTNEYTIKDQIVAFNPEVLIGFGNSQRVSSLSVGKKIKEMSRWGGKSILIFPQNYTIPADDLIGMRMDMILETPVSVIRLIQIVCKLLKQDEKAALEKLAKSFAKDKTDDLAFASFDSETVAIIQHIQGELERLDSKSTIGSYQEGDLKNVAKNEKNANPDETQNTQLKKNYFEDEKPEAVSTNSSDPFAALITELNGDAPAPKNDSKPEVQFNTQESGEKIRNEIQNQSNTLSEKIKRYSKMSEDLQLYPESTIKKVKAKKELKKMMEEWNPLELEAQDQARREFVQRLFAVKKDKN